MASSYMLYVYMLVMLASGAMNMLLLKFQTMQASPLRPGGPPQPFHHPWLQALLMMFGETFCLAAWFATRTREEAETAQEVPRGVFLVPCLCDLIATALLCMGIGFIAVSVAQMCRGTIVIFVCAMSVVFLGRRQHGFHLTGVALVMAGIACVSISAMTNEHGAVSGMSWHMLMGISLCIFAQLFQASMFVYEEKIMSKHKTSPLQVVGMEGTWGVFIGFVVITGLNVLGYEDTPGAVYQMLCSPAIMLSVLASMLLVSVFNFSGASVTQKSSAVARTTIKISSTILIWMSELALGWNTFRLMQLGGFILVAIGTLVYNHIIVVPFLEPSKESSKLQP